MAVAGFAVLWPLLGAVFPVIGQVEEIPVFVDKSNVRAFYFGWNPFVRTCTRAHT